MSSPHGPERPAPREDTVPDPCGCKARQEALNGMVPGLGDRVAAVAEPIKKGMGQMPAMLRPDMKSIVWLLIGAFVVPKLMTMVR